MNLKQIKTKLNNIKKFVANKNADDMRIFAELCDIMEFLIDETERIKSPPMATLECLSKHIPTYKLPPIDPLQPPSSPDEPVRDYPPERGYQPKRRSGNAGDAT